MQLGGAALNRKHFLDSHTAAPRSNPCFAEIFLLDNLSPYCLVSEQYILRSNQFRAEQRISQVQSAVTAEAKYNKKERTPQLKKSHLPFFRSMLIPRRRDGNCFRFGLSFGAAKAVIAAAAFN